MTVEASLVLSFILLVLGGMILRSLDLMHRVEESAAALRDAPRRYTDGLRAEDLIRVGAFIREWFPSK